MNLQKPSQKTVTQAIDVMQWTLSGDDTEAAEETRRQCRLAGPYAAGYLIGVLRGAVPGASVAQRVRSAGMLFEGGGIIKSKIEEFGVFREPDESHDADGRDTA